jgi:hypothetical protein
MGRPGCRGRLGAGLALLGLVLLLPRIVFAAAAIVAAEPGQPRKAFAVVIGNNHSLSGHRPDLHYADDDAVRYFQILKTIASGGALLLADLDRDTERLFPEARVKARRPTRVEVLRAGREIGERVREAALAHQETDLYLVFAGHGDVDEGTGFIELADARFTAADLEAWLRAIPFSRAHVILDSCNSFFMLGARRPGGTYFATPEDAARALASRLPNVGVFLSTSAEGEAFEWSEIQSGVFSHVVRSGLLGAADANGDGAVSYVELAAFVATATADVRNPNMRPHVFARGPGARDDTAIVDLRGVTEARRLRLSDAAPLHVRVLDREGVPVLDAHAEAGVPLQIVLPETWASGALIERRGGPGESPAAMRTYAFPDSPAEVNLASLQLLAARGGARGPAEIFEKLFVRPYGPRALSAYLAEIRTAPAPVFGVSRSDVVRMNLLLDQIESAEHDQRLVYGVTLMAAGGVLGAAGAGWITFDHRLAGLSRTSADVYGGIVVGVGALALLDGGLTLARAWPGERLASSYRADLRMGEDPARAFAAADQRVRDLAASEARKRRGRGVMGGGLILLSGVLIAETERSGNTADVRIAGRLVWGGAALVGASMLADALLVRSPLERLTEVWRRDPGILQLQPSVAATRGGPILGLLGRF